MCEERPSHGLPAHRRRHRPALLDSHPPRLGHRPDHRSPARARAWIQRAGHRLLQLLPPHELAAGETSPYGARTAFGLDPIYIGVEAVPDLDAAAIDEALGDEGAASSSAFAARPRVDYRAVRALKERVLARAFERFLEREWTARHRAREALRAFIDARARLARRPRALRRAARVARRVRLGDLAGGRARSRPARPRRGARRARAQHPRAPVRAVDRPRAVGARARASSRALGVELMGDLPFVVCGESADVWSHRAQFRRDVSLGAPPDAFSPTARTGASPPTTGRDGPDDLAWIRARTRHAARALRPLPARSRRRLLPDVRPAQRREGVLRSGRGRARSARAASASSRAMQEAATERAASSPRTSASSRRSCARRWRRSGCPATASSRGRRTATQLPRSGEFPAASVATWSTHDTAPITAWWDELPPSDRNELARRAGFAVETERATDDRLRSCDCSSLRAPSSRWCSRRSFSASASASTRRPPSARRTGRTVCPMPIEDLERDPARSFGGWIALREMVARERALKYPRLDGASTPGQALSARRDLRRRGASTSRSSRRTRPA